MANQYDTNLKLQAIADALGAGQSSELVMALEDIKDAIENGGGGGTGGGIKQLLIYDGSNDPIGQLQSSIVLDEEWDKYDYLVFEVRFGGNDNAYFNGIVSTDTLTLKIGSQWVGLGTFESSYVGCSSINSDKKTLGLYGSNVDRLNRVYGLKFYSASGTGATASDISYNHSSSGLSANNVQDAIDENATAISTLNSNKANLTFSQKYTLGTLAANSITNIDIVTNASAVLPLFDGTNAIYGVGVNVGKTSTGFQARIYNYMGTTLNNVPDIYFACFS